jgi:hypothetical protein
MMLSLGGFMELRHFTHKTVFLREEGPGEEEEEGRIRRGVVNKLPNFGPTVNRLFRVEQCSKPTNTHGSWRTR